MSRLTGRVCVVSGAASEIGVVQLSRDLAPLDGGITEGFTVPE